MNTDIFKIQLIDLRFFSRIGVFKQERTVGNEFIVNIEIDIDASSFQSEDLNSTISYAYLYGEVEKIMKKEWLLLETVAKEIQIVYIKRWPQIIRGKINIVKQAPPIPGIDGKCGIEFIF